MEPDLGKAVADQTVYLMGISFMIGSLFTIFILVILDMLRAARESREAFQDTLLTSDDCHEGKPDA